jgi:S-adenosylmethionine:diacylglycerol 3-amino-3-carboxypropyl transferase
MPIFVENEQYFSAKDVAKRLRVDAATIHRWMARRPDPLPSIKIVGVRRIRLSDLETWLAAQQ